MSTDKYEDSVSIGGRFRIERERLGFTQKVLAARLATTEKTLIAYEAGATLPKMSRLILFHALGADLLFILVGERKPVDLGHPETPAQEAAAAIAHLDLSDSDADLLTALAQRMASR